MNNMGKRVLSMILSLSMLLTLLPAPALAAQTDSRGEQLDTQEIYDWLSYEREYSSDEDGAIRLSVSSLITELCNPEAPGNGGRKVVGFTLWDEANDEALVQLGENGVAQAADEEDDTTVVLYSNGDMYVATAIGPEEPAPLPEEFLPVVPEEVPAVPEETPVVLEEILVNSEEAPVVPEETPVEAEEAPVEAEEAPVEAEETPVEAEETPDEAEESPAEAEETPAEAEEAPVEAEEAPVEAEEAPVEAEEAPVEAEEAPVEAEEPEDDDPAEVELEASLLLNSAGMIPVSLWVEYGNAGLSDMIADFIGGINPLNIIDDNTQVVTFEFYDASGDKIPGATQILKKGDTLQYPAAPEKPWAAGQIHEAFDCWKAEGIDLPQEDAEIDEVFVAAHAGQTIAVKPEYRSYWIVSFLKDEGSADNCYVAEVTPGQSLTQDQIRNATEAYGKFHPGYTATWTYDPEINPETWTANGDVVATPVGQEGVWVSFQTNGGTAVNDLQPKEGKITLPETKQDGYTFAGWYTDETLTDRAGDAGAEYAVDATCTLYAKWDARQVSYTVIYWQENPDWGNPYLDESQQDTQQYSYLRSESKTGTAGTMVTASSINTKSMDGFKAARVEEKAISGDGTTIVNVYYDREVYSVYFYEEQYICGMQEHEHDGWCYGWNGKLNCKKTEHTHSAQCHQRIEDKTITAKYGANIQNGWPGGNWSTKSNGDYPMQANIFTMPLKGTSFYAVSQGKAVAYYYVESLNGGDILHHTDEGAESNSSVSVEDRYEITGFTLNESRSTEIGKSYNGAKFYYTRNSYKINFIVDGKVASSESRKFEQPIGNITYQPSKDGATFAGWYLDEKCTQKADLSGNMPARDITVYAKFTTGTVTVTILDEVDGKPVGTVEAKPGTSVSQEDLIAAVETKDEILGFYDAKTKSVISSSYTASADSTLIVIWANSSFQVKYDTKATDTVTDSASYPLGVQAFVKPGPKTNDKGEQFDYWQDGAGNKYYPNSLIVVTTNTVLTAVYTKVTVEQVQITYNENVGTDSRTFDSSVVPNNDTVALANCPTEWDRTASGYEFLGWAKTADATTALTATSVRVDSLGDSGANTLYAVWAPIEYTITYNLEGGALADGTTNPATYTVESADFTLFNPTKENFTFAGWTGSNGTDPQETVTIARGTTGDLTFTANWTPIYYRYSVAYYYGSEVQGQAPTKVGADGTTITAPTGGDATLGQTATVTLSDFLKVTVGNTTYALDRIEPVTITTNQAQNVVKVYYATDTVGGDPSNPGDGIPDKYQITVRYVAGEHGKINDNKQSIEEVVTICEPDEDYSEWTPKTSVTTAEEVTAYPDAPDGYRFQKWTATSADDTGNWGVSGWTNKEYGEATLENIRLTGVTGGKTYTFTAYFAVVQYTVIFDANDGAWSDDDAKALTGYTVSDDGKTASIQKAGTDVVTAPNPVPTRTGYEFDGWTIEGTENSTKLNGQKAAEIWAAIKGNPGITPNQITLTANWKRQQLTYSITRVFRDKDGNTVKTEPLVRDQTADYGTTVGSLITGYMTNAIVEGTTYIYDSAVTNPDVGTTLTQNTVITLYYDVDSWSKNSVDDPENTPDGIPDKKQVLVKFVSADDTKGTVTGKTVQVFAAGNFAPIAVTPVAKEGSAFDIWTQDDGTEAVNPSRPQFAEGGTEITYTAHFEKDEIGTENPDESDGIPDKYQATVVYLSADANKGTVDGEKQVVTIMDVDGKKYAESGTVTISGSNATAISGYTLDGWTLTSTEENFEAQNMTRVPTTLSVKGDQTYTFTASFSEGSYDYTVEYYYDDDTTTPGDTPTTANGKAAPTGGTATFEETVDAGLEVKQIVTSNGKTYAIERIESVTISVDPKDNVVKVYCAKDEMGTEDPNQPDGTPDKYQVKIVYQAGQNGSIEGGNKTEVLTIPGDKQTSGSVDISGASAKANKYFHFVNWTVSPDLSGWDAADHTVATLPRTTISVTGNSTYTFTANFAVDTYTVILNANGGSWDEAPKGYAFVDGDHSKVWKTVNANEAIDVIESTPVNASNDFSGWYFTPKGEETPQLCNWGIQHDIKSGVFYEAIEVEKEGVIELTAEWEIQTLTYRYIQHFLNADGKEDGRISMDLPTLTADANTPISEIVESLKQDSVYFDRQTYLYSHYNCESDVLIKDDTVIDLYYSVDNWHKGNPEDEEDPDKETGGDGIPDTQQVLVKFVSVNYGIGEVSGSTVQVYTLDKGQTSVTLLNDITTKATTGYAFDYWTLDGSADELSEIPGTLNGVEGGKTYTFTAYFAKDVIGTDPENPSKPDNIPDKYQATVVYLSADANKGTVDGEKQVVTIMDGEKYAERGTVTISGSKATASSGYALDYWTLTSTEANFKEKNMSSVPTTLDVKGDQTYTFTAYFDKDTVSPENPDPEKPDPTDPGDNVPDKYQVVVTYQIVNGVWSDGTAGDKTEVLTLYQQGNDGKWTDVTPKPALQVPTGTPNSGFKGGSWNVVPSMDGLKPATDGVNVFIFTCDPMASNILTVRYVDEYGTEIMGRTTRQLREDAVPVTVSAPAISGYVLTGAASQRVTSYQTQTITFTYARDVLSDPNRDGNGSEPGDGIPDSWQYTVTYTATNGTVSMDSTVVTRLDDNGNPSASGTARLAANQIATASRASSAYRDTPSWTPSAPVADMVISADTAFNAAFTVRSGGGGGGGGGTGGGGGGTGGGGSTGTNTPATTDITDDLTPLAGDAQLNLDDHFAYIKGYADGTVRPGNYITRAQVATIFYRLMTEQSRAIYYADSNDYTDVADDFWANKAISTLSNAEIITGFSDGTFRPNAYITRAQFAAIAARFDSVVPGLENPFSDVGEDHWARDLIAYAASKGWIGGYDDGTFRPNNNITRAAAMNLINNVLQRHVDEEGLLEGATQWTDNNPGDWHYFVVLEATNSHDFDRREEGELMENWTALNPDPVWDE